MAVRVIHENISDKVDWKLSMALMSSFLILTLQYFILSYFNLIGDTSGGSIIQLFSKVSVGLVYLQVLPSVLKRNLKKFIIIYILVICIFLLNYIIFPENIQYLVELLPSVFLISLPTFIYTLSLKNILVFKIAMKKTSYMVFVIGSLVSLLVFTGQIDTGTYSMSLSYYMLLPTIMFLDEVIDSFSIKPLIISGMSLLIILALGSRGPILSVIVFLILKLLRLHSKMTYKRAIGQTTMIGIGIVIIIFLEEIIITAYNWLLSFGIHSRSLLLFSLDETHLSGRNEIFEVAFQAILDNPIMGLGISGDMRILGGGYVHNFFLEIISNFGLFMGGVVSITLLLFIFTLLVSKDVLKYNMTIIWLSLGFVHLMISSSYLTDIKFWIFLGLIINLLTKKGQVNVDA